MTRITYAPGTIGLCNLESYRMDSLMGVDQNPLTLYKYLYGGADLIYYVDPSGNISISSVMSALNAKARLARTAVRGTSVNSFFSNALRGGGKAARGASKVLKQSGPFLRTIAKMCRTKGEKINLCGYAKGWVMANAKMELKLSMTSSRRLKKDAWNPVRVIVGAFDAARGRGTAAFNGSEVKISSALARHAKKTLGLNIGDEHECGFTVGRCAEWRSANNLSKTGTKVKNIRWTLAYRVKKAGDGVKRGSVRRYCDICQEAFNLSN